MILTDLNSSTSSHEELYTTKPQTSCFSSHAFTNSIQDQRGFHPKEIANHQEYQQESNNFSMNGGGSHDNSATNGENNRSLKFSSWKKEDGNDDQRVGSTKWTCSKMRVMGRTIIVNSNQMSSEAQTNALMKFEDQNAKSSDPTENDNGGNSSSINSNSPIRVCSDCNTTKTPLWRSGPRGPKSLCNACGIRQRKARKAMAMAATAAAAPTTATPTSSNDTVLGAESSSPLKIKLQHKAKRSNNGHVSQYKKRSKLATPKSHGRKKLCLEDFLISLTKNLAIQQVFPQDEKEAAILLMALSCGLVHG
ncbi:hypothetical protein Vadar_012688 [Vaccinium darrowii]|uniref:Uncharacterized protein n=1 Tax=Vaccinium darrowii TaxID=229202 RepID=A0ACB7YDE2_9ERIC|nr:hypothetical protein Vadar_012688 [Vaccinium darrowii]